MERNFTSSVKNLKEGRIWTLITSCFSHSGAGHIFTNLITLYFMAGPVLAILGNVGFLTVYLGGVSSRSSFSFTLSPPLSTLLRHFTTDPLIL